MQQLSTIEAKDILMAVNPMENWLDEGKFNQMVRVAGMFSRSTIIPDSYKGKAEDCLIALDMAGRIGTNPLMVMQNLYVVKGKPSWSGQACSVLISNSRKFIDIRHVRTGTIGTDSRGCYYAATLKNTAEEVRGVEVTMAMAKAEGWISNAKWRNMPELMLMYRAASFFAKEFCPEMLMGCQTDDEMFDSVTRPRAAAQELTDALRAERGDEGEPLPWEKDFYADGEQGDEKE